VKLLEGRTALVTGGSRGLGRAICKEFAKEGARVAFNYQKSRSEAEAALAALREGGAQAWAFQCSVSDKPAVDEMVRTLEKESGGPVDILVNNAGVGQVVPLALMTEEDWDRMLDTHVKGAFLVTQSVLRGMIRQKRGRILNVSSLAGAKMIAAPVHYCTAKAALKGFTESLSKEVGRYGITVNAIAPGILEEGVSQNVPKANLDEFLKHCALRRTGTLQEVAALAALLVSDRNSYMTGATVIADGGV
jgi:NAD(P)-dependent dehydrogenase (short-subunit alcohol dehydrogenase family)